MADNPIVRRRAACDRCHSQKLRCHRQSGMEICDRCARAHRDCLYSPFRQKPTAQMNFVASTERTCSSEAGTLGVLSDISNELKRKRSRERENRGSSPRPTYESELQEAAVTGADGINDTIFQGLTSEELNAAGLDIMLHADIFGPSAILDRQAPESRENSQNETTQHHSAGSEYCGTANMLELILQSPRLETLWWRRQFPKVSQPIHLSPKQPTFTTSQSSIASSCIQTLSKLAVDLHRHHMTVPPQSIHNHGLALDESRLNIDFSIDNTFRLTQSLVDIYPSCIDTFITRAPNLSSGHPSEKNSDISREHLTSTVVPSGANVDQPSILLILSCHMRLIEIYEEIFAHAHACIDQDGTTCNHEQTYPSVPALRIGSFVPSPSMAASMQMMLVMQLSTQLLDYATQLFTLMQPSRHAGETAGLMTSGTKISLGTAENVRNGAHNMLVQFTRLHGTMKEKKNIAMTTVTFACLLFIEDSSHYNPSELMAA
ncbi:Transcription factor ACEII protein [Rutstroemia sp. NJR-2017a WRK4]|nr:Transcription factor ACEII protein [Rutstroemia sp. NJR-2017a WRK4]